MPSKKKKNPRKPTVNFTTTIPLPQIKRAKNYSEDFWKKFKLNRATLSVQNSSLFITADNKQLLASRRATIQTRIQQEFIGKTRVRNCQYSKHINQSLCQKRKQWNKTKMIWKQWYTSRGKFNVKFKSISKYFGTFIRRRHPEVSSLQQKYSHIEYYQQKALGRKPFKPRAVRRARRARQVKRKKIKKNKWKQTLLENAPKYNGYRYWRNTSEVSKLKFTTVDAPKTIICQSKKKKKPRSTTIVERALGKSHKFPLCPWIDKISIDRKKFVIRYYNQHIFIYAASIGTKRPSQRKLVYTFSTLNGNEIE